MSGVYDLKTALTAAKVEELLSAIMGNTDSPNPSTAVSSIPDAATIPLYDSVGSHITGAQLKALFILASDSAAVRALVEAATDSNVFTDADHSKLDGIEAAADVTDATNVDAAGATMNTDTNVSGNSWVLDEDNMVSDDATKVPTQQSVKAYVDTEVASAVSGDITLQGDYNASTNTPDLDTSPSGISKGDQYVVSVAGTFFTVDLEIGDQVIAKQDNPTLESHWIIAQANLTSASIKTQYESNADTNAFTDAEQTKLSGIEIGATADQTGAEIKAAYEAEANTNAFTDAEKTNLAAATLSTDTDVSGNSWVVDEDDMTSNLDTKVPTQQSVKAYVDAATSGSGDSLVHALIF